MDVIQGIHHVTAIAGAAQSNYDFYTQVLGLRLVKRTVNFDDPGTYHFYFGNETGDPGTILTFFPWHRVRRGSNGSGMVTETAFSVPTGSLGSWEQRLKDHQVIHERFDHFNEAIIRFEDPDGLVLRLVEPAEKDDRKPYRAVVDESMAIRGFQSVILELRNIQPTAELLSELFGYDFEGEENNFYRFRNRFCPHASVIDVLQSEELHGQVAGGTVHHVAFRVATQADQKTIREKIHERGLQITPVIDRNYFFSVYFREPGGVLFEIATDEPGFLIDEDVKELGSHLKLPPQYEVDRTAIEKILPVIKWQYA